MTCHNRKRLTLECLSSLIAACGNTSFALDPTVYLVDDGCSDGTADEVGMRFPQVRIIRGTGNLYWCGGMRRAWQEAAQGRHDEYLWLNDDVTLEPFALQTLYDTLDEQERATGTRGIVVGSTRVEGTGHTSYGSLTSSGVAAAVDKPTAIKYFNGNIVLVSDHAFRVLGNLSTAYTHGFGDLDYGIRARRRGVPAWLAPGHLGACSANVTPRWQRPGLSTWQRLKELHRPTGCPPRELAHLMWTDGAWWAPWTVLKLYAGVLCFRDGSGTSAATVTHEPRKTS
jgi:GT2 family glycosyltransferase